MDPLNTVDDRNHSTSGRHDHPIVCVLDEDPEVTRAWGMSLGPKVEVEAFQDPITFLQIQDSQSLSRYECLIVSRMFPSLGMDIVASTIPLALREKASIPIFLNWQGYIAKADLDRFFDGKVFQRYGVKWATLRQRLQRVHQREDYSFQVEPALTEVKRAGSLSRIQKCQKILERMARNADGPHKDRIEYYVSHDQGTGVALLEALYNRLITFREQPRGCPSRYINSSPIIAARILDNALN